MIYYLYRNFKNHTSSVDSTENGHSLGLISIFNPYVIKMQSTFIKLTCFRFNW